MIKGINRQIIEVNDTGNPYYEKAFLVVKPEYKETQEEIFLKHAKKMLSQFSAPSVISKKRSIAGKIAKITAPALLGSAITALVLRFF